MMSTEIAGQEYIEELCILVGIAVLLLLTKLYACCVVYGAYNQARVISNEQQISGGPDQRARYMLEMSGLPN